MTAKRLLIIGFVWPEPTSSAAGTRMIQLVDLFLTEGYEVTFASAASKSDHSYDFTGRNVVEQQIKLNDESFDHFIKELNPELVLFDRFMVEEQYGWRVQQECPRAVRILDTEDLHFLRKARQEVSTNGGVLNLFSETAKREIASILRCDLSLIISKLEMEILSTQFKLDASLLYYLPFLEQELTSTDVKKWVPFEERKDFIFIGNFHHEPNWNTVQILKTKIWPLLRKKLPSASINIYGAYASQKVLQLENKKEHFFIKGRASDAQETISRHSVLLAPIQFGAGVKGKFIDAMRVGTPTATTTVGAEAMLGDLDWNGFIEDDLEVFVAKTAELYSNKALWLSAQKNGLKIINELYNRDLFVADFLLKLEKLTKNLPAHRQHNFFGQILNHHICQSTKYMSLWIEEKNKA